MLTNFLFFNIYIVLITKNTFINNFIKILDMSKKKYFVNSSSIRYIGLILTIVIIILIFWFTRIPKVNNTISTLETISNIVNQTTTTSILPNKTYDLQVIDFSVVNPFVGRGETILIRGKVTDLYKNPISYASINVTLIDNSGIVIANKTFQAFANGTFFGGLDVIYSKIKYFGDYNLSVQAYIENHIIRLSNPVFSTIHITH
jgi:hypothetical protein